MSEDIYKIISFPAFVNLVTMKEEIFVHPLKWEDTHEGLYYTVLNRQDKCGELLHKLFQHYEDLYTTLLNFFKVIIFPAFTYAQCWSTLSESDALWRIYSYEKNSVQIHTTVEDLRNLLETNGLTSQSKVTIDNVKYDLKGNIDEMFDYLQDILLNKREISDPFFHKRPAFEHEKEKRVIIYENKSANTFIDFGQLFISYYVQKECPKLEDATIDNLVSAFNTFLSNGYPQKTDKHFGYDVYHSMSVPIANLSKYIKSVKLNPFAPDWIDKLMGRLCTQNGLIYEGRSNLYEEV